MVVTETAKCRVKASKAAGIAATFYKGTELRYESSRKEGNWRLVSTIARNYKCWIQVDEIKDLEKDYSFLDEFPESNQPNRTGIRQQQGKVLSAREIADKVLPSVVLIITFNENGKPISQGSGFFVRPNVVVTNYHVIKSASAASVKMVGNSRNYSVDGVVGIDKTNDLVLLSVSGLFGKPLSLVSDLARIDVGQDIFALGNPQGLEGTISSGIVSSKVLRQIGRENLIQITAPISPGSSGGPVVNEIGQVIGVATASLESGQNLNFAVPAVYIGLLLNSGTQIMSFSEFAKRETPSMEETTDWLTKTLSGLKGQTMGSGYVTNTGIKFDGCRFRYYWESPGDNGIATSSYLGTMADFVEVGFPSGTIFLSRDDDRPVMFLGLTFKTRSIDFLFSIPRHREFDVRFPETVVGIYLNDKRLQQSVGKAFLRLKGYCVNEQQ